MKAKTKVNLTVKNLFTFKNPLRGHFFETTSFTIDPTTTTTTSVSTMTVFGGKV